VGEVFGIISFQEEWNAYDGEFQYVGFGMEGVGEAFGHGTLKVFFTDVAVGS